MKYLNYYSTILEAAQGATQGQVQGQVQGATQSQAQDQAQGTTQSQAQGQVDDQTAEKKAELDEANKKLEEKYPELKTIAEELSKFLEKNMDESTIRKFEGFMDEMMETEGFKEAMVVLRKIVKELGILKSLKMIKNLISTVTMSIKTTKKIRNILSEGEKYNLCVGENCSIIANPAEEDDMLAEFEEMIDKIKDALTVKNLMNILTGKTDELELEYMTKAGKEAEGEIKNVEIKDDGSIEVSIENDKVGTIKKDLTEITAAGDDVDVSEDDLPKKLAEVQTKRPDDIKKVSNFVDFISNDTNKENSDKIYKIMGI
jgi:vacuolar-type H+-ATPase subunit I/STV1